MSNRHDRRRYRHDAARSDQLLTFLVPPDDKVLASAPFLHRVAQQWLDALPTRVRHCLVCNVWIVKRQDVGALLISTPAVSRPVSAGSAAVCKLCWDADLGLDVLERACETALKEVIPNGKFEPLDVRR